MARRICSTFLLLFSMIGSAAAEISGEVAEVDGRTLLIKLTSAVGPREGDPVDILVEVAGVGEALVARGVVKAVVGKSVVAEVVQATGRVAPGHKVRIPAAGQAGSASPPAAGEGVPVQVAELAPLASAFGSTATWHGSLAGSRDFSLSSPKAIEGGWVFECHCWPRASAAPDQWGRMEVMLLGRKVKMVLTFRTGGPSVIFDGVFSTDGRVVGGRAYENVQEGEPLWESIWWATVEARAPAGSPPIGLNTATVGEIASQLGRPRDAWFVFEHRLRNGPFERLQDLDEIWGIDPASLAQLKEKFDVRQ